LAGRHPRPARRPPERDRAEGPETRPYRALRAYTIDAAYASHSENELGSVSPGKLADLVVLSQDVFTIDPAEIHKVEALLTIFDGRVVYRSESSFE